MRKPDFEDIGGKAWQMNIKPTTRAQEVSIALWLIEGNHHPLWRWHAIYAVHLRDIPGIPPAKKMNIADEHEIGIMSVDPECRVDIDSLESGASTLDFLRPPDLVYQFQCVSDEEVVRITSGMIQLILTGKASPDVDFRSIWKGYIDDRVCQMRTIEEVPK